MSQIAVHRERYPSGAISAIPAQRAVIVSEGIAVYSAQAIVNPVVAVAVVVVALEDELSVDQSVVTIVAEHGVVPEEVEQAHISQVDDVVGIAVNLIAIVVQEVKRYVKERSEVQTQNPVDDGCAAVGSPTIRDYRAIPYDRRKAIGTDGRRQGTTPTPGVVSVVVVEVVVVVVAGIVKVVVVRATITMTSAVTVAVTSVAVTAVTIAAVTVAAMAVAAAVAGLAAVIGLAIRLNVGLAAIAGLATVTGLAAMSVAADVGDRPVAGTVHAGGAGAHVRTAVAVAGHGATGAAVAAAVGLAAAIVVAAGRGTATRTARVDL